MTTTGQELIESAKEALAFARGEALCYQLNDDSTMSLIVGAKRLEKVSGLPFPKKQEVIDTDAECPIIPVHDMGDL